MLWVRLTVTQGSNIEQVAREMVAAANHMQVGISMVFNGVELLASDVTNVEDLVQCYYKAGKVKSFYQPEYCPYCGHTLIVSDGRCVLCRRSV